MGAPERLKAALHLQRQEIPHEGAVDLPKETEIDSEIPVREFTLPSEIKNSLDKEQRNTLAQLMRVGRRIGDLYLLQEKMPFYPDKLSTTELYRHAEENPDLISPYTYVRRDAEGGLYAIPIHEVFRDQIKDKRIPESLKHAANLSGRGRNRNNYMQAYFRKRAEAFEKGNWEDSEKVWLESENLPEIFMLVGPYDTYLDKKNIKFAWQSWVGVLNKEKTKKAQIITDKFIDALSTGTPEERPKVRVRVDHTVMMSGQAARFEWTGNSMPCQKELRDKYGSVFFIFEPVFNEKFRKHRLPVYRSIIDPSKRSGISDEAVEEANFNRYVGHESTHPIIPGDFEKRLKEHSAWVEELYCDLISITKGAELTKSKRESTLLFSTYFANGLLEYMAFENTKSRAPYYIGNSIALKHCVNEGNIKIEDGIINWDDSKAIFDCLNSLTDTVGKIVNSGDDQDAFRLSSITFDADIYKRVKRETPIPDFLLKRPPGQSKR